jgi:hypothetical protein
MTIASKLRHIETLTNAEWDERADRAFCSRCGLNKPSVSVKHSYGIYAGRLCDDCARAGYRDACGLDGEQGSQAELEMDGEVIDED